MNDTTDVNEEKRESPFYSFFDADLVFDIIKAIPHKPLKIRKKNGII